MRDCIEHEKQKSTRNNLHVAEMGFKACELISLDSNGCIGCNYRYIYVVTCG